MCLYSNEAATRRAEADEMLFLDRVRGHNGKKVTMGVPERNKRGAVCACLQTGDLVQFCGFSETLQQRYCVGPNPVASFVEGSRTSNLYDKFDLNNGNVVNLIDLPLGTRFRILELVGQPRGQTVEQLAQAPFAAAPQSAGAHVARIGAVMGLLVAVATLLA